MRTIGYMIFLCWLLLLGVFFNCVGAEAALYYVATTGNDATGDGSIERPWLTVPKGIRSLRAGDTLYIRGGTYTLNAVYGIAASDTYGCQSGCPTSWATATKIMNYPGERVTINHLGINMDNNISIGGVAYLIWQGDSRTNFIHQWNGSGGDQTGMRWVNGVHHIRMQRMTIRNFNSHGMGGGGTCTTSPPVKPTFIEVLDNEVRNNGDNFREDGGPADAHEHGIYPSCGDDWLIDGNYFVGNYAYGIHVNAKNSNRLVITRNIIEGRKGPLGTAAGIYISGGSGHSVINNLIIGKGNQANKLTIGAQVDSTAINPTIFNNTIYDVPTGIFLALANGAQVQNNLLNAVTTNIQDFGNNTKAFNLCTVVEVGCSVITPTPSFMSTGSNFRLAQGSLAIDAGANILAVTSDIDRGLRPAGNAYDIGAYEAGATSGGALSPPRNLTVR
jgi:hypothetical protein